MAQSAKEFFESLTARANGRKADGIDASYVFDISGSGTWTVKIHEGKVAVTEGDGGGDCTVSASEETFRRILDGRQKPLTAYMTGKLKVRGDMNAALRLKDVLG